MHWLQRLLMATDFSEQARRAEDAAIMLASAAQAQLDFIHIIQVSSDLNPYPQINEMPLQTIREEVDKNLAAMVQRAEAHGVMAEAKQGQGLPSEEVIEAARAMDADLVIVGTQGRTGLEHVLLGSTAERVIKGAPCPVLTIPSSVSLSSRAIAGPQRLVIPVDFSECSLDALEYGAQVAKAFQAQVSIIHVLEWISVGLNFSPMELAERNRVRDEMVLRLSTFADAFKADGIAANATLLGGAPVDTIIEHAEQLQGDLIIMGTHGRRGLSRVFFGSIAEGVLRRSGRPVMTVKSPKFRPGHRRILTDAIRQGSPSAR